MRSEVEAVIVRVLTNPMALRVLMLDMRAVTEQYDLSEQEIRLLRTLREDLKALAPAVVRKRSQQLKRPFRRSAAVLGEGFEKVVSRYIESCGHDGSVGADQARFGHCLLMVAETRWQEGSVAGAALDLVRAEVMMMDLRVEGGAGRFIRGDRQSQGVPVAESDVIGNAERVKLRPGARAARFDYEIMTVAADALTEGIPVRECWLLFVAEGGAFVRVRRVTKRLGVALESLNGQARLSTVCEALKLESTEKQALQQLVKEGVLVTV